MLTLAHPYLFESKDQCVVVHHRPVSCVILQLGYGCSVYYTYSIHRMLHHYDVISDTPNSTHLVQQETLLVFLFFQWDEG